MKNGPVSIRMFVTLLTRPTPIKLPRHDLSAAASSDFEDAGFNFFTASGDVAFCAHVTPSRRGRRPRPQCVAAGAARLNREVVVLDLELVVRVEPASPKVVS